MDFIISKYLFFYNLDGEPCGNLKLINYKFNLKQFYHYCEYGPLFKIQLLSTAAEFDKSWAFRCCCDGNQLEIAQWLTEEFKFTRNDVTRYENLCCSNDFLWNLHNG